MIICIVWKSESPEHSNVGLSQNSGRFFVETNLRQVKSFATHVAEGRAAKRTALLASNRLGNSLVNLDCFESDLHGSFRRQ